MRDRRQMENRIIFDRGVKTGVIAKRPFRPHLTGLNVAFQNEINICRHIEIDRFAAHQLD